MDEIDVELILARQLMSRIAVPVLLVDARGDTLFFNEAAGLILGRAFDAFDAMPFEARTAMLAPRDDQGRPLPAGQLPGMVAMRERRPVHAGFQIHSVDGALHAVQATAIPLEGPGGNIAGAAVVLWEQPKGPPEQAR